MTYPKNLTGGEVDAGHLRAFIERVERLHEERKALGDDIRDVFNEAASDGFDKAALKKIIADRRMDPEKRADLANAYEAYRLALGME